MRWFIFDRDNVLGPYSAQEVKDLMANAPSRTALIWSQVMKDWTPADQWLTKSEDMIRESKITSDGAGWHYASGGAAHGPFSKKDLIKTLTALSNFRNVLLWTKGFPDWVSIYQVHEILEEVGINRRAHPRAPISGVAKILSEGKEQVVPVIMISQGGIGIDGGQFLAVGQEVTLEISSPALGGPIRANGSVRYISRTGYSGLKFNKIHPEAKSMIVDYVRVMSHTTEFKIAS